MTLNSKFMRYSFALSCAVLTLVAFAAAKESPKTAAETKPRIEVCFVLDTTSSMTGTD